MAELLVLISCLAVLAQPSRQRVLVASLYSGLCLAHMLLDMHVDGLTDVMYYATAGAFSAVICQVVFYFTKQTRFTDGMITVSLCSFAANLYGWIIYCLGMEPDSFVAVSCAVLIWGIAVLFRKDGADESCRDNGLGIFWGPLDRLGSSYSRFYKEERA